MRPTYFFTVVIASCILSITPFHANAESAVTRECRDPSGRLLYTVHEDKVRLPDGRLLGTIVNGKVRDPSGRLIATGGDAGLLFCLVKR